MEKLFAFIILLCFTAVSLSAASSALNAECVCVVDCNCGIDCCCPDDCACKAECTCPVIICSSCEAIIKKRGTSEQQSTVASMITIDVNSIKAVNAAVNSDVLRIYIANIIDAHIRMNN